MRDRNIVGKLCIALASQIRARSSIFVRLQSTNLKVNNKRVCSRVHDSRTMR